jgi:exopolyphosphatase/guanosine-5'-triphosphate,3'-diphosphate pyrophosphatase
MTRRRRRVAAREPGTVAAVDLGSNSFHMIVARLVGDEPKLIDRLQEGVRLAAGLDEEGRLSRSARERALDCLGRFGQRLRGMKARAVRAVGTSTLRRARDARKFLARAEKALGHPIEIISGQEEARLIYQGVARSLPADGGPRLVIDIGGGSTELILGERLEPRRLVSLPMGCVNYSRQYFRKGRLSAGHFRDAETAARVELEPVEGVFEGRWQVAIGSSGTVRAVAAIARANGWGDGEITRAALKKLRAELVRAGHVERLALAGLNPDRAPVIAGGVAVLGALFEALEIECLQVSDAALREGLLHDLLGRLQHRDVRKHTIRTLGERYQVDTGQSGRVAATAMAGFEQVRRRWKLEPADGLALDWAARLHEIGIAVSHSGYHKHGAYLIQHGDLAGFSRTEQRRVALLVRAHRRPLPRDRLKDLPTGEWRRLLRLATLLRLSVLLHRARLPAPALRFQAGKHSLKVQFPRGWLARHPLTVADLEQETRFLREAGMRLACR